MEKRYDFHEEVLEIIRESTKDNLQRKIKLKDLKFRFSFFRVDGKRLNKVLIDLEKKGAVKRTNYGYVILTEGENVINIERKS